MYVATKSNECKTVLGYTPNAYYRCTQMHARTHLSNGKGDILCRLLCMTTDVHKCMCYIVPHDKSANAPLKSNALELAPWSPLRWKNTDPNTVVTAGKVRYRTAFQGAHMYAKYKWHSTALRACIHEYINARMLTILQLRKTCWHQLRSHFGSSSSHLALPLEAQKQDLHSILTV